MPNTAKNRSFAAQIESRIVVLALFIGSMWAVFFLSAAFPSLRLTHHGVVPRTVSGLQGILFAPWLHASLGHIMANTGGLVVLGWLAMWPRIGNFVVATAGGMLGAGCCAWLLGAPYSVHIGASGLVFGYAGYLVARGIYTRHFLAMLVALFVVVAYGISLLSGVLPVYPGISWQSHLGGAIGGVLAARLTFQPRVRLTRP
ncbi:MULTISPECIES: rhomboid family intramembrane serine protease [unclassified Paraburkholderia]|uniref:rhomboid family intramembrane serine protease n=1 Tax=unclassified Paraburkholderia TaxID=2615204 RepID=UPI002AB6D031|nr:MULTISPECIES: rhomboid family intramembrane serine protease [unclassified Paraburkholderia]